ncbi:HAD family hydrolase [Geobacillus stearothermophilus]|uniref:HAD family hydrolase n=1 Tax=Geobacillus stearothermophilus TaxID=1422 RepID=UPI002E1E1EBD|nr:HAD family hydrolase [Geobacillus stearothermophilus]
MIEAIIFDLDDTLFPESEFVKSGFMAVDNYLKQQGIVGFYREALYLFNQGTRGNIFNLALDQLKVDYDLNFINKLVAVYREHLPTIALHEDAKWAIQYLKDKYKLGIITDGFLVTQKNKVKALGIADDFDVVVFSDAYGRENWKPSSVPYTKVMEALQLRGEQLIYVGDNPAKDFVTAKKMGWLTIQIKRKQGEYLNIEVSEEYQAHFVIESLFELKDLLLDLEKENKSQFEGVENVK